jgi:hypothetical protein
MEPGGIIAIAAGVLLVAIAVVVLVLRSGAPARPPCGGCGRAMLPSWRHCMFCGWQPQGAAPAPPPARLEFVGGPLAGQVVPLGDDVTTIGSVAGNTVVLSDPAVSRKHVGIRRVGNRYEFADLGSTNGVYVNGHRMAKKTLAPGDLMRVGNTELVFRG